MLPANPKNPPEPLQQLHILSRTLLLRIFIPTASERLGDPLKTSLVSIETTRIFRIIAQGLPLVAAVLSSLWSAGILHTNARPLVSLQRLHTGRASQTTEEHMDYVDFYEYRLQLEAQRVIFQQMTPAIQAQDFALASLLCEQLKQIPHRDLPSIQDKYMLVNKPTDGTTPNDTLVNKPIVETTSNKAYEKPITVAATHLIREENKEDFMIVIANQALEEIEYPVEHNINDTMHATVKEKNKDFNLMEKLIQSSPSRRIMLHQQQEGPSLMQDPLLGCQFQKSYNQWLSLEDKCWKSFPLQYHFYFACWMNYPLQQIIIILLTLHRDAIAQYSKLDGFDVAWD
eukprot:Gb_10344 [translate_table: standard]